MIDINNALDNIEKDGFVELTGLISDEIIDNICNNISRPFSSTHVNGRRGFIKMGKQHFLANTLTWGRDIIDIYTNPQLIELAEQYAGGDVHLSNYRIYKTLPSKDFSMWWHVDNKIDTFNYKNNTFDVEVVAEDKGLIVIMYLVDVEDGGVQLVKGSHKWSRKYVDKESFDDMESDFKENVVSFNNKPKGTLIAYDYATIHRATPYLKGPTRMSLFGQYSPEWMPVGEPIILHSRDLDDLSQKQKKVLNFGKSSSTENWPIASPVETLSNADIQQVIEEQSSPKLVKHLIKRLLRIK